MNSFTLTGIGNLTADPEQRTKGNTKYTRFCLIASDSEAKEGTHAANRTPAKLWFVAFGPLGDSLLEHARQGDQIIVAAHVQYRVFTDKKGKQRQDRSFVVSGFRFGAPGSVKRAEFDSREDRGVRQPGIGLSPAG